LRLRYRYRYRYRYRHRYRHRHRFAASASASVCGIGLRHRLAASGSACGVGIGLRHRDRLAGSGSACGIGIGLRCCIGLRHRYRPAAAVSACGASNTSSFRHSLKRSGAAVLPGDSELDARRRRPQACSRRSTNGPGDFGRGRRFARGGGAAELGGRGRAAVRGRAWRSLPSENLSRLPVTSSLMLLMFFNLYETSERGRVCSRAACRSWRPTLLHV